MREGFQQIVLYVLIGLLIGLSVSLCINMLNITGAGFMPIFIYAILLTGRLTTVLQKSTASVRKQIFISQIFLLILSIAAFIIGYYPAL